MATWEIPPEKIIDYLPTGDLTAEFAQKVKWCLEEAFGSLKELHDTEGLGGLSVALNNITDGQMLVYRQSANGFVNENKNVLAGDKSLIIRYGDALIADYNGSETVTLDLQGLFANSPQAAVAADTAHALRLLENLYLTLDVAQLNPGGYDGLSGNTFFGSVNDLDTSRSVGTLVDGKISGNGAVLITKPISFVNKATGTANTANRAHLTVKHRNIADAAVTAEIAFINAAFVKSELLGIGTGAQQTATLAHTTNVTAYNFAVHINGANYSDYSLNTNTGQVTFTAPAGAIVTADYFYNWGVETFASMTKTGTYPDYRNHARASTQFEYSTPNGGSIAVLKISLNQGAGTATNEISTTGTGQPQGFKLAHQAVESTVQVTPSTIPWQYDEDENIIVLTAPLGTSVQVSYQWLSKDLGVDSFACTFN